MANDVAKNGKNGTALTTGVVDPFEEFANEFGVQSHINGDLLKYTKHGVWKSGQEGETVDLGTRMLAYIPGTERGYVKWQNQKPVQHHVGLVEEGYKPPTREELGDTDESKWGELNGRKIDPWQMTIYLPMLDEFGQLYTYSTSSKGGFGAIADVVKKYNARKIMRPGEIPIVQLQGRSYDHEDYGETFAPVLRVEGWAKTPKDFEDLKASLNGGVDETDVIEDKVQVFAIKAPAKAEKKAVVAKAATDKKSQGKKGVRF
jgi:hypothetical protein